MKKLIIWSIVVLGGSSLSNVRVWAADDPKQDSDLQRRPGGGFGFDIEGLSNKIADLVKYARWGVLLQAQFTESGFNAGQPKGFSSPVKVSPSGRRHLFRPFFWQTGRDQFDR